MNFQPDILAQIIQAILHEDRNTQVLLGKWNKSFIYIYHTSYREQQSILGTNNKKEYRQVPSDSGWNVFFSHSFGQEEDEMTDAERNGALREINQGRRGFSWVEQKGASTHPPVDPRHVEADHDERFVVQHREWCHEWWGDACKGWRELFRYNLKA